MVIEFYGDYWHRNPKKYKDKISGEIRKKDRNRIDIIKKKFNSEVIIIWEDEYRDNREDVLDRIERYIILYKQYKKDGIIL